MAHGPRLEFNASGRLIAIATGRSASPPPLGHYESRLCNEPLARERALARLIAGHAVTHHYLLDSKRIAQFPSAMELISDYNGANAALGLMPGRIGAYPQNLAFPRAEPFEGDPNVTAFFDEQGFVFCVRGPAYAAALRRFYARMQDGHVCFAGFLQSRFPQLDGVVLADTEELTEEDKAALVTQTQAQFSKQRLTARDESAALEAELSELSGLHISALWPVWSDAREAEVVYGFNPGNSSDCCNRAERGVYRPDELRAWARTRCGYHLVPTLASA